HGIEFELDDEDTLGTITDGDADDRLFKACDPLIGLAGKRSRTPAFQYLLEMCDLRAEDLVVPGSIREAAHFACWSFVSNASVLFAARAILQSVEANPRLELEPLAGLAEDLWRIAWSNYRERQALCEQFVGELSAVDDRSAEKATQVFQL